MSVIQQSDVASFQGMQTMPLSSFQAMMDHPRQRDTKRHAEYSIKRHLANTSDTQMRVAIAEFEGTFYKVDGHTRNLLWSEGKLSAPKLIHADVYKCNTKKALLDLYDCFDNKNAAESTSDRLAGAIRQAGIVLNSNLMAKYQWTSALNMLDQVFGKDVYVKVQILGSAIAAIDSINPSARIFKAPILAAALILLHKKGQSALEFFNSLNQNAGVKTPTYCDGVQALHYLCTSLAITSSQSKRNLELFYKALSCYETWRRNKKYRIGRGGGVMVKQASIQVLGLDT